MTLLLWLYYTLGYVFLFSPFYLAAALFAENREHSFQRLNHLFYRGFFALLRRLTPRTRWSVDQAVKSIRSAVVVCNHVSYLDSILMISLFERHRTVVKNRFFSMPIFRQVIRASGYIPARADGPLTDLVRQRLEEMDDFFADGGVLFVFPEGTRSRDGAIGALNSGVFKIARLTRRPIEVLFVENTDKLFPPGRFLFDSGYDGTIRIERLDSLETGHLTGRRGVSQMLDRVQAVLAARQASGIP